MALASGLLMLTIYLTYYGLFIFTNIGPVFSVLSIIYISVNKIKSRGTKLGLAAANIPMFIMFYFIVFHGIGPETRITDLPSEKIAFHEIPEEGQLFFEKWRFGNPNNRVGSNGFHAIGHTKQFISRGYFEWIKEGAYHTFYFPKEKALLNGLTKNAFFLHEDAFYYSSDFTSILPISLVSYYRVDITELLHPEGNNNTHEFDTKTVSDGTL